MRHGYTTVLAALSVSLAMSSLAVNLGATQQYATGITGCVTTLDGAVIPGVEIQLSQGKKKLAMKAITNTKGEFWLELRPGIYDVLVEWPSFKPAKRKNIKVEANGKATVDIVLRPGKPVVFDPNHP